MANGQCDNNNGSWKHLLAKNWKIRLLPIKL